MEVSLYTEEFAAYREGVRSGNRTLDGLRARQMIVERVPTVVWTRRQARGLDLEQVGVFGEEAARGGGEYRAVRDRVEMNLMFMEDIVSQEDPFYRLFAHDANCRPILDVSQFWLLKKQHIDLDKWVGSELEVNFCAEMISPRSYMFARQMEMIEKGMDSPVASMALSDLDFVKEFLGTNTPTYLTIIIVTNLLHVIFSSLAVKNGRPSLSADIQYWKNLNSFRGIAINSIFYESAMSIVSVLYLVDNEAQTLAILIHMIQIPVALLKLYKTLSFKRTNRFPFFALDTPESYKGRTFEYERTATKYLTYIMAPFVCGYFVPTALRRYTSTGWARTLGVSTRSPCPASWAWPTCSVSTFEADFINLTPQLFVNYKLKSVEGVNWRGMTYKFLNTIIDDLFVFSVSLPTMTRIATFADDVVFVVYIYQRWIYRVDNNRTVINNLTIGNGLHRK